MSVITDIVTSYAQGEIDFGQAREALRQVKARPLDSGGYDFGDYDTDGTLIEVSGACFGLGLSPEESYLLTQSLVGNTYGQNVTDLNAPDPSDPDIVESDWDGQSPVGIFDILGEDNMPVPADPEILTENGVPVEKHFPGGQDHDQERHGDWSSGPSQDDSGGGGASPGAESDRRGGRVSRPKSLSELVGQDRIRQRLDIIVKAAKARGEQLPHILFTGPPGLGKTTMAKAIANDFGTTLASELIGSRVTKESLQETLLRLNTGDMIFIDEIHALSKDVQEILYPALEDFEFDADLGGDTPTRIPVVPFTLIGATTNPEGLLRPFRERFGQIEQLQFYDAETLAGVATRTAEKSGITIDPEAALELGERGRGTPRAVNKHVADLVDYLSYTGQSHATVAEVGQMFSVYEIDSRGLNKDDRSVLRTLADYQGEPVGVNTIAQMVGHDPASVEFAIEPYLLREGLIRKTPRGRIITEEGLAHIAENEEFFKAAPDNTVSIVKADSRRNLVFGWANVAMTPDGQVEDHQGHLIDLEDLENAAYNFVVKYRVTGDMHKGEGFGELVESLVVTEDKVEKAGFPRNMLGHWWVGFKVPPEHWDAVNTGDRMMFSIQGKARLEPQD